MGGRQNYYLDYENNKASLYMYSGYYNPFSIWGN